MDVHNLPLLNAILNSTSAILLIAGFISIRTQKVKLHRAMMLSALACSVLFLTSYLVYHAQVGSVKFTGLGPVRIFYFTILVTHTILAVAIVPLVLVTLSRALRRRYRRHRSIAVWTLPLWLYVSVTGVIIYLLLYQFYPAR